MSNKCYLFIINYKNCPFAIKLFKLWLKNVTKSKCYFNKGEMIKSWTDKEN